MGLFKNLQNWLVETVVVLMVTVTLVAIVASIFLLIYGAFIGYANLNVYPVTT